MTGEYVMACDSDDFFRLDAVEQCVKAMLTYDECDGVFFNARNFYENGDEFPAFSYEPYNKIPTIINCKSSHFLAGFGNVCFGMFSTSLIQKNKLLFREGYIYEDWDFVAGFTACASKVCWININLYNYRRKKHGTITGNVTDKCLDIFITFKLVEQYYKDSDRWESNQYIFYLKAISHIIYFSRDRLLKAEPSVKDAFMEKGKDFIKSIPYTLLCSLTRFFPTADRIAILKLHEEHGAEIQFCLEKIMEERIRKGKQKIRALIKKIMMRVFPAYRVSVNTRYEIELMNSEIIGKLNEITWLHRKDIDLIMRKMKIDGDERFVEEVWAARENENSIK